MLNYKFKDFVSTLKDPINMVNFDTVTALIKVTPKDRLRNGLCVSNTHEIDEL